MTPVRVEAGHIKLTTADGNRGGATRAPVSSANEYRPITQHIEHASTSSWTAYGTRDWRWRPHPAQRQRCKESS